MLDYLVSVLLIASPWILGFADHSTATWIPVILGIMSTVYSLITRYELGAAKILPMQTHLWLDLASGLFLAASPWLFGFADRVYAPHVIFGIFEVMASLMTRTSPEYEHRHSTSMK